MTNSKYIDTSSKIRQNRFSVRELVLAGMFAAVLTVISQISIPMPSGIPITIQVFGVALIGTILGWKLGTFSILVYILLGTIGLPVFSNFHSGPGILFGPTGGYIWSWPIMSLLCGIPMRFHRKRLNRFFHLFLALTGLLVVEIVGGLQWHIIVEAMSLRAIFLYSITAFVPKDILLTIMAVLIGCRIKKSLK